MTGEVNCYTSQHKTHTISVPHTTVLQTFDTSHCNTRNHNGTVFVHLILSVTLLNTAKTDGQNKTPHNIDTCSTTVRAEAPSLEIKTMLVVVIIDTPVHT